MTIEEADFKLESAGDHFWDVSFLRTVKSKEGERQEFKIAGYGLPLLACLKRIADFRVEMKHPEAMTLKEYIEMYKEEITRLEELVNNI